MFSLVNILTEVCDSKEIDNEWSGDVTLHTHYNHPVQVIMKVDSIPYQGACVCTVYCTPCGDHVTHCPRHRNPYIIWDSIILRKTNVGK